MNATKDKVIKRALELFNLKGIEYVGMRELAADLGMRIGNLTYYFPTKDDLVFSISQTYTDSNSKIHIFWPPTTLYDFLYKSMLLFKNGLDYQCLMLSMVHIMEQNTRVSADYQVVVGNRLSGLRSDIETLVENGFLTLDSEDDKLFIISSNSLQNRFWLSEAVLTESRQNLSRQMTHYLKMKAHLFRPYATKKGLIDIERFVSELD